ncbi:MAG: hypothetical protein LBU11_10205 [Zoogloeaceae bacterium]|nr:hypothetical protein [Zoogloeaceae bacterium]
MTSINKSVIYAVVITVLVIASGGGIYLFTRPGSDAIPSATKQSTAKPAKTAKQYLHDIDAAYEMQHKCNTGMEDVFSANCQNSASAILDAREWVHECFDWDGTKAKLNANTHACLGHVHTIAEHR